jgi:outer membrane protein TolC
MAKGLGRAWCLILSTFIFSFSISLEEAERLALRNFHGLKIERLEERKKAVEREERFGRFLPNVNLEASFNLSKKQSFSLSAPSMPPTEFVFQKGSYPKFTLQLVQEIFNLRNYREYEIARRKEKLQKLLLEEKERETLFRVREAYINALKSKALIEIQRQHLELVKAHLRDVKELYREGIVAFKDVLETQVKLYEVKEKLTHAEAGYRKALKLLSYLVGKEVKDIEPINPEGFTSLLELSRDELKSMLERRALLRFLRESANLSKDYVYLSEASFYPTFVMEVFYQRTEESDLFPKDRYLISLAFRWNLFSGLRRFKAVELSRLTHRQAVERYVDTRKKLEMELDSILEDIKASKSRIELAKKQLEDAREHFRIAQEKYRAGLGTNTEVLDAQSYLITAKNTLRINEHDLLLKAFKLSEVVGYGR